MVLGVSVRRIALASFLLVGPLASVGSAQDPLFRNGFEWVTAPCASQEFGDRRDCGYAELLYRTCTPAAAVTAACSAICGLGSCTDDTVMHACAGHVNCFPHIAIASNDDSGCGTGGCGSLGDCCSRVAFTCPASGQYTIVWGSYDTEEPATCNVAAQ